MSSEDKRNEKRLEDNLNVSDGVFVESDKVFQARVCHL